MPPKSIKPPRSPRSDDDSSTLDNSDDEDSPLNSITSINSLASLLKEKLQVQFQKVFDANYFFQLTKKIILSTFRVYPQR